jgi:ABC-type transport system involved in cytochrome c biogenesis permease component
MGLFMVLPLAVMLALYNLLLSLENDLLLIVGVVMLGYTAVFGSVGAMMGGYMVGRSSRKAEAGAGD